MASDRSTRSVVITCLAVAGIAAVASPAAAQRKPRIATAAQPTASPPRMYPFFGVTDLRDAPGSRADQRQVRLPNRHRDVRTPMVYYVPVPVYGRPARLGRTHGVYDTSGRPLSGTTEHVTYAAAGDLPGTPDLSGSPYTVTEDGVMVVAFANGVRRSVTACAAEAARKTPDGQPRTVFFQSGSAGVILPGGDSGRVRGEPNGAESVCYTADSYGRLVLAF